MKSTSHQSLRVLAEQIAQLVAELQARLQESQQTSLVTVNEDDTASSASIESQPAPHLPVGVLVDPRTFSVTRAGDSCFLGDTISFRLLQFLVERPNRFWKYSELLTAVWQGDVRSDNAIRTLVFRLRTKLRKHRFPKLANSILAAGRSYGLFYAQNAPDDETEK